MIESGKTPPTIKVGNLEPERDFSDVRDVIEAYYKLEKDNNITGVFNVCSGKGIKISRILEILISMSKTDITVEQDPERMRPSDVPVCVGDNTKLCKETGWAPRINIETTLKDLLDYWRKNI